MFPVNLQQHSSPGIKSAVNDRTNNGINYKIANNYLTPRLLQFSTVHEQVGTASYNEPGHDLDVHGNEGKAC